MRSRFAALRRACLLLLLLPPALGGCIADEFPLSPWNEKAVLRHGWVRPRDLPPERVYCYRTLAKVDCYDEPLPGQAERREGTPVPGQAGGPGRS